MTDEGPALTAPIRVSGIPADGRASTIEASESQRQALARSLDIPAVKALRAELDLSLDARKRVTVRGRVRAEVVRTCVVTLEEVPESVDEEIATVFVPAAARGGDEAVDDVVVDPEKEDVEVYDGDVIDLGVLIAEHLALGLDPYPRKADVAFEGREEISDEEASPFAALAALRAPDKGKG